MKKIIFSLVFAIITTVSFARQVVLSEELAKYLPLTGGTLTGSLSIGPISEASGTNSLALGYNTKAIGTNSFSSGYSTMAIGHDSQSAGIGIDIGIANTWIKSVTNSNPELNDFTYQFYYDPNRTFLNVGTVLYVNGIYAQIVKMHGKTFVVDKSFGNLTSWVGVQQRRGVAYGGRSHSEGDSTTAGAYVAHAEGDANIAGLYASHAEGRFTVAQGPISHTEGHFTRTFGTSSHAEGTNTVAYGIASHAEGFGNGVNLNGTEFRCSSDTNYNDGKHYISETANAVSMNNYIRCQQNDLSYINFAKVIEISSPTNFVLDRSIGTITNEIVVKIPNISSGSYGDYSHSEGRNTFAYGNASHSEGFSTKANGDYSHAEGLSTVANGNYSHAEGFATRANGDHSHADGWNTDANGNFSYSQGYATKASGFISHSDGFRAQATNDYSFVWAGRNQKEYTYTVTNNQTINFLTGYYPINLNFEHLFGTDENKWSSLDYVSVSGYNIWGEEPDPEIEYKFKLIFNEDEEYYEWYEEEYDIYPTFEEMPSGLFEMPFVFCFKEGHESDSITFTTILESNNEYGSHGNGTFNINPNNGMDGFYIGEKPLSSLKWGNQEVYVGISDDDIYEVDYNDGDEIQLQNKNGSIQYFGAGNGGPASITLILPEITLEHRLEYSSLTLFIYESDDGFIRYNISSDNCYALWFPVSQPWDSFDECAVWKIKFESPPGTLKWYFLGAENYPY